MEQSSLNVALADDGMFASDVPNHRWVLNTSRVATNFQTKSNIAVRWALVANHGGFQQALSTNTTTAATEKMH